ncbi:hypothetical protein NCER_100127 [Vairimorpha ceranae BRL01]|uniref:DNA sliding clamp PCNA n=2 Tax=Vairimorpha ceranae TaxID=40302 RepID=C4V6T2_VAIC1|nr:proliferating cell nuclear antigen [Vairimorpha ceranae]EEQ83080.1 hypothetical protein NCER_100127 [Vairimorpha ceranae BRL01]KAF5140941.1 hypothetical protein G9O61_00g009310 [Vairimorpha ceranae]KKO75291.1 proliferating cell nuclear antigen [Vairimorpha ceranae]
MFELEISHQPVQKKEERNDSKSVKKMPQNISSDQENMEGNKYNADTHAPETLQYSASIDDHKIDNTVVFPGGKIGLLRKTFESIAEIVDHVEIKARSEGLEMQVMDSIRVVFIDIFLSKNLFDKYRCDRNITFAIKVKDLITILKDLNFPPDSSLHLSCDDNPESLIICYKYPQYVLNWELSLYSFDNEVFELPEFEFQAEVTMYAKQFMVLPKLIGIFGEFITIEASKNTITFKQKGDTTSSAMNLHDSEDNDIEINVLTNQKKEMAMKYIGICAKVAGLCSKIKLHMGDDTPIFFDFNLYDLGHIRYYIAPKTESEY